MKAIEREHRARPWRVHEIAAGLELLDLWRFELGGGKPELDLFLEAFWDAGRSLEGSVLAQARLRIGRALGWDDRDFTQPIPGCSETSVSARLTEVDRAANRAKPDAASPLATVLVRTAYVLAGEALYEFSNDTVHGLLHVGVADGEATLAVYAKTRGALSRLYLAAIWPFRHAFVYPALIRRTLAAWQRRSERGGQGEITPEMIPG